MGTITKQTSPRRRQAPLFEFGLDQTKHPRVPVDQANTRQLGTPIQTATIIAKTEDQRQVLESLARAWAEGAIAAAQRDE